MPKDDGSRPPSDEPVNPMDAIPSLVQGFLTGSALQKRQHPINLHEDRYSKSTSEIRDMEDGILQRGMEVIGAVTLFGTVDPERPDEPSREMVDRYGHDPEKLREMHRIAKYALLPAKDAPVALKLVSSVVVGIARARSAENMAPREMKVAILNLGGGVELPTQELDE